MAACGGYPPTPPPFLSAAPNALIKQPLIHFALPLPPSRRHVAASATTSQHLGELHAMLYRRHLLEWVFFFSFASPISDDSLCLGSTCLLRCAGLAARRFSPSLPQISGVCNLEPLGQNERFHPLCTVVCKEMFGILSHPSDFYGARFLSQTPQVSCSYPVKTLP